MQPLPTQYAIVLYTVSSGELQALLFSNLWLRSPDWSPDGDRFCHVQDGDLWVCDAPVPVTGSSWGAIKRQLRPQ